MTLYLGSWGRFLEPLMPRVVHFTAEIHDVEVLACIVHCGSCQRVEYTGLDKESLEEHCKVFRKW